MSKVGAVVLRLAGLAAGAGFLYLSYLSVVRGIVEQGDFKGIWSGAITGFLTGWAGLAVLGGTLFGFDQGIGSTISVEISDDPVDADSDD